MTRRTKPQAAASELAAPSSPPSDLSPTEFTSGSDNPSQGEAASTDLPKVPRASVLSDTAAGVRFYFDYEKHRGQIAFEAKPGTDVITYLRHQGFDWDRQNKIWWVPIRFQQREQDRLAAKRIFHKVCEMVRAEKGLTPDGPALPDCLLSPF